MFQRWYSTYFDLFGAIGKPRCPKALDKLLPMICHRPVYDPVITFRRNIILDKSKTDRMLFSTQKNNLAWKELYKLYFKVGK